MQVGDILRMRIQSQYQPNTAQVALNIVHYVCTQITGAGVGEATIALNREGAIAAPYKAAISVAWNFRGVDIQKIWPPPFTVNQTSKTLVGLGTLAGDPLPPQLAGFCVEYTGFIGRNQRSRLWFPSANEANNDANGLPVAAYLNLMAAAITQIWPTGGFTVVSGADSNQFFPCVWHNATKTQDKITSVTVRSPWGTMRKRGYLGRPNPPPF